MTRFRTVPTFDHRDRAPGRRTVEGWRLGLAALSTGIFGIWFAWMSNGWSKVGKEIKTTWWATAAFVMVAIAIGFLAVWIF